MDRNIIRAATAVPTSMTSDERAFFQAMGERIAEARKTLGMTQAQLADELGVAQQVVASYEIGRHRVPASFLPRPARTLAMPVEELIGEEPQRSRRGPAPKLLQQVERIQRLPKSQQRFVIQMIDTVLQQQQPPADGCSLWEGRCPVRATAPSQATARPRTCRQCPGAQRQRSGAEGRGVAARA